MVVAYLAIIMVMRILQSLYGKKVTLILPSGFRSFSIYSSVLQYMSAAFGLLVLLLTGNFTGIDLRTVLIACLSGSFLAISSYCGIKALLNSTMVLSSIFGTAGLIVPCVLGIFFFNENISILQFCCIFLFLFSAVLLISSSKRIINSFNFKTLFYLLGSFFSNGMVMFCQKYFGEKIPGGNVSFFSMLTFLIPAVVLTFALPFTKKAETNKEKFPRILFLYSAILAFAVFIIQQFVTILTPLLSSAVLFSSVNGGATIISAIVGAIVYKEKLTTKSIIGLILGIASLIFIKIF